MGSFGSADKLLLCGQSHGTIRNKLIAGHKRCSIYFANGITIFCAEGLLFLVNAAIIIALGIPMGAICFQKERYKIVEV